MQYIFKKIKSFGIIKIKIIKNREKKFDFINSINKNLTIKYF